MINKKQIARIHIIKAQLRLSDAEYGEALNSYGVKSSKEMNAIQAAGLIKRLSALLPKELQYVRPTIGKYDEYNVNRRDKYNQKYATPKQMRMLEAVWMSNKAVRVKTEAAFTAFLKRIAGVDSIKWLLMADVQKVLKAIQSLQS